MRYGRRVVRRTAQRQKMSRPLRESLRQPGIPTPDAVLERAGAWIYRTALRLRQRMPWAEVDDLVQHGIMVALEMRDRNAPERGVPFDIFIKQQCFGLSAHC